MEPEAKDSKLRWLTFTVDGKEWEVWELGDPKSLLVTSPSCTCDYPPPPPMRGLPAYCGECRTPVEPKVFLLDPELGDEPNVATLEEYLENRFEQDPLSTTINANDIWAEALRVTR